MQRKNWKWRIVFILLCIWQLPQLIVGLIMMLFVGKLTLVADRHYNFCWKGTKMKGGISLGPISFVSERCNSKEVIAHEVDGHTKDSKLFGPLYLLVIGIPSLVWAMTNEYRCYYDFYTEKRANKNAGLVVINCELKYA